MTTTLAEASKALKTAMPAVQAQLVAFRETAGWLTTLDSYQRLCELEGWLAAECTAAMDELLKARKPSRRMTHEDEVRMESAAARTAVAYRALSVLREGLPTQEELRN